MEVSEFYEETLVKFSPLSEELLWEYIHSGEPMCVSPAGSRRVGGARG